MIQHVCCNSRLVRLSLVAIRTRSSSHPYEKRVSGSVSCWSLLLAVTSEENRGKIVSVVILDAVRPTCRPEERSGKKAKGFERQRSLISLHGRLTETVCRKADRETVIAFGSLSGHTSSRVHAQALLFAAEWSQAWRSAGRPCSSRRRLVVRTATAR